MRWHWHRWGPWEDEQEEIISGTVTYTVTWRSQYKRCRICNKTRWKL